MRKIKIDGQEHYVTMLKIEFAEEIPGEIVGVQIGFDKPIGENRIIRIFPESETFQKVFSKVKWGMLLKEFLEAHYPKGKK